jgi:hypothetical protein
LRAKWREPVRASSRHSGWRFDFATTHIARLARAAYVAREGVFGVIDPDAVPPPGSCC